MTFGFASLVTDPRGSEGLTFLVELFPEVAEVAVRNYFVSVWVLVDVDCLSFNDYRQISLNRFFVIEYCSFEFESSSYIAS